MARSTSSAIFAIFLGSTLATLPGCNTDKVPIGQQNEGGKTSDAAAGGGGVASTDGANADGGNAKTGGATGAGGVGGAVATGGANASGGIIGSGGSGAGGAFKSDAGCAPGWTMCCGQCLSPNAGICAPCSGTGGGAPSGGTTGDGGPGGAGGGAAGDDALSPVDLPLAVDRSAEGPTTVDLADGATACRSKSDCPQLGPSNAVWGCYMSYDVYRCGPVLSGNVGMACTDDAQCGGGNICRKTTISDGGLGSSALVCVRAVACTADSQCGAGQVCRSNPTVPIGWISPSGLVCSAPCSTDLDCAPTDKCESGGHCQARTCAECPSYLSCTSGTCVVPGCSTDTDCSGGYCVTGLCAGSLGICRKGCS